MNNFSFFITSMPDSRRADYYLGCLDGSVFIDFNNHEKDLVCLKRISFDGYGCCNLENQVLPMNNKDSMDFKKMVSNKLLDQTKLTEIIKRTIIDNKELLWEDALTEYGFI